MMHEFHIYEFASLIEFLCEMKINTHDTNLWILAEQQKISASWCTCFQLRLDKATLCLLALVLVL